MRALANPRGTHPLFGTAHPMAPPLRLVHVGEGGATAVVTFDARFEGLRGCVHGGFIAAGFDVACGMAVPSSTAAGGPTGTLAVRYRALTPIGVELRDTSQVVRVEGRTVFVEARLATAADDRTTAEAQAVFMARPGWRRAQRLTASAAADGEPGPTASAASGTSAGTMRTVCEALGLGGADGGRSPRLRSSRRGCRAAPGR